MLGDVAACLRAACVLCAVQNETAFCTAHNTHAECFNVNVTFVSYSKTP